MITRKRPPGAIRAVKPRREAHHEQSRAPGTERGDGTGVVVGVLAPDPIEVGGEPGTVAARGVEHQ